MYDLTESEIEELIQNNPSIIEKLVDVDARLQMRAVESDINSYWYIQNPDVEVTHYVLSIKPNFILDMQNPSNDDWICAIEIEPSLIKFMANQTEDACWLALRNSLYSYQYIDEPTPEMNMFLVSTDPSYIDWAKDITDDIIDAAIKVSPDVILSKHICPTHEQIINAIHLDGTLIRHFDEGEFSNEEIEDMLCSFWISSEVIKYVEQTDERCIMAIKSNVLSIKSINEIKNEYCICAIHKDYHSIKYMKYPNKEVFELAMSYNEDVVSLFDEHTEIMANVVYDRYPHLINKLNLTKINLAYIDEL